MSKLIYCATPSRLIHMMADIMDYVTSNGDAPLHPFQAFPYERFEGNPHIGREKSMEWCLRLVEMSDEFCLFGVSIGTLEETVHAVKMEKQVSVCFDGFDPDWERFYAELGPVYGNPLDEILRKRK